MHNSGKLSLPKHKKLYGPNVASIRSLMSHHQTKKAALPEVKILALRNPKHWKSPLIKRKRDRVYKKKILKVWY